jgi:hypothetical protein
MSQLDINTLAARSGNVIHLSSHVSGSSVSTGSFGRVEATNVDIDELNNRNLDDYKTVGKETIWVPANAMTPTETDGCSAITAVETMAYFPIFTSPDLYVLDFPDDANAHAQFSVAFPKSWNLGTITYQVFWTRGDWTLSTDCVEWGLQGVAFGDNDGIGAGLNTGFPYTTLIQDNSQGMPSTGQEWACLVSAESGDVTIAGSHNNPSTGLAHDQLCYFRVLRNPDGEHGGQSGADDMSGDARLHGIKLFFTTDTANDD